MIFRRSPWIFPLVLLALALPGCAGLFAKQAIEQFAKSLEDQDLEKLKMSTSEDFEQKALRQEDALKGLKVLKLPVGKVVEVVSDETLEDGKRKVIAKVGEKDKAKEIEYRLSKNTKGKWVIDDVIMKQDSGGGIVVERSVSEQMDLILTCRELLIAWREGQRSEKLEFCDAELKSQLETLPPTWLQRMSKDIVGTGKSGTFKPDARLQGNAATVIIPNSQGNLYLNMRRVDENWLLHDLAMEPTGKDAVGIRSLSKMTKALNQSAIFLSAYAQQDREKLEATATSNFYRQCLSGANLEQVPVPTAALLASSYEARQFGSAIGDHATQRTELLLRDDETTYMLTLRNEEAELENGTKGASEIRVEDVTIFENDAKEVKRLSAMFLSHDVVRHYIAALRDRDVKTLKGLSTSDFNDRVWNRSEASHFAVMPDPELSEGQLEILATIFRGETSEVTIAQGDLPMTIVLHSARNWMVVDDVVMPALNRPTSLKANLEVLLSVQAFASAVHRRDLNGLIKTSADGLDRMVWKQLPAAPELVQQVVRPMLSEVVAIEIQEHFTVVRTSDGLANSEIRLIREGQTPVVHDVVLTMNDEPQQRFELLQTLRKMIASGELTPVAPPRPGARPQPLPAAAPPERVEQAAFAPIDAEVYNR